LFVGQEAMAELTASADFTIRLGAHFPDFHCETTRGSFSFHDFLGSDRFAPWTILFSHPRDFTPVCTTEIAICSGLVATFAAAGVKLIGLSCDGVSDHAEWAKDVLAVRRSRAEDPEGGVAQELSEAGLGFPLIADEKREIATRLGMLDPRERDAAGSPMPARALFVIGPDRTNRATVLYPATTGRNFVEVLRVIQSLLLTQDFRLATPGNWRPGGRVIVCPGVSTEEAEGRFGNFEVKELPSGKPYLRYVDCPCHADAPPAPEAAPCPPLVRSQDFGIKIGAALPDFECRTTHGDFAFHDFLAREPAWTILFSHPKDFTPVCTTELGICHAMAAQFLEEGVKLIGLSCDPVAEHRAWSADVLALQEADGGVLDFPLISDESREIAVCLGMLDPNERDAAGVPMPARALFFIAPDRTIRATILYPATTGRDFHEVLRVVRSLRLTEETELGTPGDWKEGERVIVGPALSTEKAQEAYANLEIQELPSKRPYLRYVDCPERT